MTVSFIPYYQATKVEQPTDGAFDFPAALISPQCTPVLRRWFYTVLAMRTDQLYLPFRQLCAQGVAVGRTIINQAIGVAWQNALVQQGLNQLHLCRRGTGTIQSEREPVSVDQQHKLGSLSPFCLADIGAPFFAGQNVPSPNASDQTTSFRRSRCSSNRCHASRNTPSSVHSLKRRQQVLGDGKNVGKSFHRAPVLNTQRIPSRHSRAATLGRPPVALTGGSGNRSLIRSHCSSESCGFGSVLDPVMLRPVAGRDTRVMVIMRPPFWGGTPTNTIPNCSRNLGF